MNVQFYKRNIRDITNINNLTFSKKHLLCNQLPTQNLKLSTRVIGTFIFITGSMYTLSLEQIININVFLTLNIPRNVS